MLAWRKETHCLRRGNFKFIDTSDHVIGFVREDKGERITCVFNCQNRAVSLPVSGNRLESVSLGAEFTGKTLELAPYGFAFMA
jgi:glycosidase